MYSKILFKVVVIDPPYLQARWRMIKNSYFSHICFSVTSPSVIMLYKELTLSSLMIQVTAGDRNRNIQSLGLTEVLRDKHKGLREVAFMKSHQQEPGLIFLLAGFFPS